MLQARMERSCCYSFAYEYSLEILQQKEIKIDHESILSGTNSTLPDTSLARRYRTPLAVSNVLTTKINIHNLHQSVLHA